MKTKVKENQKGITLIALVITIIVLLILASVSIAMLTGDNGILTRAGDAKIETALGAVKEQIGLYQIENKMNNKEVTAESLLAEGKVSRTVQAGEADKYYMYYALKENSFEGMQGLGKGNIASLKDVFLIDDNLNVKYISSNGKEYGDNLNNKVLEDETEIRFSSKAFSEYVSKISGVTEDEMKFKWMKNQTSLTIADTSVNSLEDLVFFPNLTNLTLENLNLQSLEGIENCSNITSFRTNYTFIKDYVKLSKLYNLNKFYIYAGKDVNFDNVIDSLKSAKNLTYFTINITPLKIKSMKRISELSDTIQSIYLRGTYEIQKIEGLENKTNLIELNLSGNKISEIQGLENCKKLKILNLESNKISKIENIENLQELTDLYLGKNKLVNILNVDKNTKLIKLGLQENPNIKSNRNEYTQEENTRLDKIQEIITVRNGRIDINTEQLKLFKGYKNLRISNSDISTLECLEGQTELVDLYFYMCKNLTLTDEKSQDILKNMTKLKILNITGSNIQDLTAVNELKNLTKLTLEGGSALDLSQIEDIISQIRIATTNQNELDSILKCSINKVKKLDIYAGREGKFKVPDYSIFTGLTSLSLLDSNMADISNISKIASLKSLNLSNTNLHGRMIDFSKLVNLTNLNLSYNTLWSEDLENLKALKNNTNLTINLSNNSIIDATALLELNSSTKINLSNNVNLSQDSKDKLKAKFGNNVTF